MATAKKATEPEDEGVVREVAEPYVPKCLRRPAFAQWPEDILAMQRHGFITITLPETRDPMGQMPKSVMTENGLRYIYRGVDTAVPLSVMETLDLAVLRGVKMVPNPVFEREFANIEEVPQFVPRFVTEETEEKRFRLQKRAPKDYEIGLALQPWNYPLEAAELKNYDPEAYAKYEAAWATHLAEIRRQRLEGPAKGAHKRI